MNHKPVLIIAVLLAIAIPLCAAEYSDGTLRLVLHEKTGRFSLYAMETTNQGKGQALFSDEDPGTSFLSVMVNDRSYKMGDSGNFRISLAEDGNNPSFIFDSPFMIVTQKFSFIKTPNSAYSNAVKIQITLENRSDRQVSAGARFLLDTKLGEGLSGSPFKTGRRTINSETLLTKIDDDQYWIDRNETVSLAGSFITNSKEDPDSIHFANWKKLSGVSWKAAYQAGRNFNYPPYSIGDTAVCYYFENRPLSREEKAGFTFTLASNYEGNFIFTSTGSSSAGSVGYGKTVTVEHIMNLPNKGETDSREKDLAELRELIALIEIRIAAGTATVDELAAFEFALNKLRAKYGSGDIPR